MVLVWQDEKNFIYAWKHSEYRSRLDRSDLHLCFFTLFRYVVTILRRMEAIVHVYCSCCFLEVFDFRNVKPLGSCRLSSSSSSFSHLRLVNLAGGMLVCISKCQFIFKIQQSVKLKINFVFYLDTQICEPCGCRMYVPSHVLDESEGIASGN